MGYFILTVPGRGDLHVSTNTAKQLSHQHVGVWRLRDRIFGGYLLSRATQRLQLAGAWMQGTHMQQVPVPFTPGHHAD
ncbi:hypothetical protein Y1Q_0011757 [Alligator mississippiensis]|uniref:Uncharacterized protein n=1 Tax=Alligator mississippiensis TaxID=8496 RepID=A0A151M106_ALLMI|nr:hypothetical protein Y1Q_0011757 [Alligator mississippiensis]